MHNPLNDDDGLNNFHELLGGFGSHANTQNRAKAERYASMKPTDPRRKKGLSRPHQFNVRVNDATKALADALTQHHDWSQADLVEAAITALAKAQNITAGGTS